LWILDATPLRQMTQTALKAKASLYQPNTVVRWRSEPQRGSIYGVGARKFIGENAPRDAHIFYSLTKKAEKVGLKIVDVSGKTIRELPAKTEPGLHMVAWDLTASSPDRPAAGGTPGEGRGPRGGGGGFGGRGFGGGPGQAAVAAGTYRIVLTVDGEEHSQNLRVESDPVLAERWIVDEEE
jgi:hypothetical protein